MYKVLVYEDPLGKAEEIESPTPGPRQQEKGLCSERARTRPRYPECEEGGPAYHHHLGGAGGAGETQMQSWAGGN